MRVSCFCNLRYDVVLLARGLLKCGLLVRITQIKHSIQPSGLNEYFFWPMKENQAYRWTGVDCTFKKAWKQNMKQHSRGIKRRSFSFVLLFRARGEINMHTDIVQGFNDRLLNSTVMLFKCKWGWVSFRGVERATHFQSLWWWVRVRERRSAAAFRPTAKRCTCESRGSDFPLWLYLLMTEK